MMYQRLNPDELLHPEGELRRRANALHQVWNDIQYDFFMEEYILPVEQIIGKGNSELLYEIDELYRYCRELEDI